MSEVRRLIQQGTLALAVAIIGVAAVLPSLFGSSVASAAQVTSRKITMSSSAPGATGVTYTASFVTPTGGTIQGVVIDFCANSPLLGDTCTTGSGSLTGFTLGGTTPSVSQTGLSGTGSWTAASSSPFNTLKYTNGSATSISASTTITVTISGVTNPTPAAYPGSFYARIALFATSAAATSYTSTSPGAYVDAGGDALSTAQNISITAKVFETLSFCVFQVTCGTAASLTLGDPTTGALSSSSAYANGNAWYTIATNAGSGVSVVMRGTTLCNTSVAACQSGTASVNTITPLTTTPTAVSTGTGTEQFGMCVDKNASAPLTTAAAYTDSLAACHGIATGVLSTANTFGFDNTAVISASGSQVVSSSAAVPVVTGSFVFAANIAPTTEAAIYTTSLNMVATSTF